MEGTKARRHEGTKWRPGPVAWGAATAMALTGAALWYEVGAAGAADRGGAKAPAKDAAVATDVPDDEQSLIRNGGFDQPNESEDGPAHWGEVDNLVFFWTHDPQAPRRKKVIHINTDVLQSQAYAWWVRRYVKGEPLRNAPKRIPPSDPGYDTIAGLDGGFYASDLIPVKAGGAYKVYIDAKGPKAKVFIRGYEKVLPLSFGDEQPAVQQVFRRARGEPERDKKGRPVKYRLRYRYQTWFAVGGSDEWQTYTHVKPRHPNSREITEDVRYIRIQLYPYWPRGDYWFDNVRVVEVEPDPDQARPSVDAADVEERKVVR